MQAQLGMAGEAQALAQRNQGNAIAGQMAAGALQQNYQNAGMDMSTLYGSGYLGGAGYGAGNLSGSFGMSGGISASFGM